MERPATDEVLIRREGRAGRITMNRPKALNALTYAMVGQIWDALVAWQDDPAVELVLLDGAGDRALCAGGDVRSLYDSRTQGLRLRPHVLARRVPAQCPDRPLSEALRRASRTASSWAAASASPGMPRHRIVTERSRLAMPETGIGLIPDVGGTWLLAHAPGQTGIYLGLTGENMSAADAIHARFSDTFVPSGKLGALTAQLCDPKGGDVRDVIASHAETAEPSSLARNGRQHRRGLCRRHRRGHSCQPWRACRASGRPRPRPRSHRSRRRPSSSRWPPSATPASLASLDKALIVEYRLTVRLFEDGEFPEGVRALLVDKDRKPRWSPPQLDGVTPELVAALSGTPSTR